jgi:hypothetical protein
LVGKIYPNNVQISLIKNNFSIDKLYNLNCIMLHYNITSESFLMTGCQHHQHDSIQEHITCEVTST